VALLHAGKKPIGRACADLVRSAFTITRVRPRPRSVIVGRVTAKGLAGME
jgi:hypothetical protein